MNNNKQTVWQVLNIPTTQLCKVLRMLDKILSDVIVIWDTTSDQETRDKSRKYSGILSRTDCFMGHQLEQHRLSIDLYAKFLAEYTDVPNFEETDDDNPVNMMNETIKMFEILHKYASADVEKFSPYYHIAPNAVAGSSLSIIKVLKICLDAVKETIEFLENNSAN